MPKANKMLFCSGFGSRILLRRRRKNKTKIKKPKFTGKENDPLACKANGHILPQAKNKDFRPDQPSVKPISYNKIVKITDQAIGKNHLVKKIKSIPSIFARTTFVPQKFAYDKTPILLLAMNVCSPTISGIKTPLPSN